jgi:hypothetical protein
MPAETHQHSDALDPGNVVEILLELIDPGGAAGETSTLGELGIDGSPAIYDLWDAVIAEFGERTVASRELDAGEVTAATTVGELAQAVIGVFGLQGQGRCDP